MLTATSRERRRGGWRLRSLTETNLYSTQSLPYKFHNLCSQRSLYSMMTNRPGRSQAFRSSGRLLPRAWACTGNEDHWLREVREARERSSHTISNIEEASLQSRSPECALYNIVQCLSQVCTHLKDLSCGLIAYLHVLLDQHHCQLWYQNGNNIVG
jgi:hypothetical protein